METVFTVSAVVKTEHDRELLWAYAANEYGNATVRLGDRIQIGIYETESEALEVIDSLAEDGVIATRIDEGFYCAVCHAPIDPEDPHPEDFLSLPRHMLAKVLHFGCRHPKGLWPYGPDHEDRFKAFRYMKGKYTPQWIVSVPTGRTKPEFWS